MQPKRILFAYEFGSGHGHHVLLTAIETELRKRWPDLVSQFILPPHSLAQTHGHRDNVVLAPELKKPLYKKNTPNVVLLHSLCEFLLTDPSVLQARLIMWRRAIETFKPDLVIADYAPSLSMAAAGKVPCLMVGTGYSIPPPELETCLPVNPNAIGDFAVDEENWLRVLNVGLKAAGCRTLQYLPQMNRADEYCLFTIPLFDPYWQDRQQHYRGVYHPGGSPVPAQISDGTTLAYFSSSPVSTHILEGMIESALPTRAYFANATAAMFSRAHKTNVTLVDRPFNLVRDLASCSLVVHAGSLGMSAAGVYAGIPQVGLYYHDEGQANCRSFAMAQIGLSTAVKASLTHDIAKLMVDAKNSSTMRNFSTALSHRYAAFRDGNVLQGAVESVVKLLA